MNPTTKLYTIPYSSGVLDNDSYLYWTENHDSIINNFTNFLNEIKNNNEFIINDTYKNNLSSRLTDLDNPTVTIGEGGQAQRTRLL